MFMSGSISCTAYIVPEKALGSAYGIVQSMQNLGLAVLFSFIGQVVDNRGYFVLQLLILDFLFGQLIFCF